MFYSFPLLCLLLPIALNALDPNSQRSRLKKRSLHKLIREPQFTSFRGVSSGDSLCASDPAKNIRAPKKNIWAELTREESKDVRKWFDKQKDLKGYIIYDLKAMAPNKTDALRYVDDDSSEPPRYAHVLMHKTEVEGVDYFHNILIGPLPLKQGTAHWEYLTFPYTKQSKGKIRNLGSKYIGIYNGFLDEAGKSVADITLDLWNGTAAGYKNDTLYVEGADPLAQYDGVSSWFGFFEYTIGDRFDIDTLLPLGLYFQGNFTGEDKSKWGLTGWLYNGVYYRTTKEFREAYWSKKNPLPRLPAVPIGKWADTDQRGPKLPLDQMYPPTLVAPSGSRFSIDRQERYVKWMDFEFYIAFLDDTGLRLHDIKYKGKRILYELGLQEALAHYAGNDPIQSGTAYLDSLYDFGGNVYPLLRGYDCPSYSTFLDYNSEKTSKKEGIMCLFEMDAGYPLARHAASRYLAVTKNIFFTLRSITTLGNYDYMFSYEFYMDGSIRVDIRASGYIQAAYFAKNHEYGYQIHEGLSGSMHDHVLNYKADFDILGTKNTMETVKNVAHTEVYPWSNGKPIHTMKLERGTIDNENESKIMWDSNGATQYKIVNYDALNKYGEAPGYRIMPSSGTVHLVATNSTNLGYSAQWAYHDLFVTKQKDTEPRSADPYNGQDIHRPLVNFDDFFDGESLKQEDIVTWFNLGMHHVPHTGDLPNTVFTTAHSAITISPLNYLHGDPSVQSLSRVRVQFEEGSYTPSHLITFGQDAGSCKINYTEGEGPLYGSG